jgi:signal transduction histidine kinase
VFSKQVCAYADEDMINTIIRNLLNNALKFTNNEGEVAIIVDEDQENAILKVRDNGVGMDEHTQKQLFKMEDRTSQTGTSGEVGTGLGLILCKEFAEKNHAQLEVESEVGKGSTFILKLPKPKPNE